MRKQVVKTKVRLGYEKQAMKHFRKVIHFGTLKMFHLIVILELKHQEKTKLN